VKTLNEELAAKLVLLEERMEGVDGENKEYFRKTNKESVEF
jgi:hypothetical protein